MKTTGLNLVPILLVIAAINVSWAREPDPDNSTHPEARVQALEQALEQAKGRISELEAELNDALSTISKIQGDSASRLAADKPSAIPGRTSAGEKPDKAPEYALLQTRGNAVTSTTDHSGRNRPVAVTRLTGKDIERAGIQDISRVADMVPGMQFGQSGNEARIAMRGARSNRTGPEAEMAVAIFEDGVNVPTTTQALGPYTDIAAIEVLRGPQGVMYGRNALGGVIRVSSNQPVLGEWDSALSGTIAYADRTRFEGMLNLPVRDSVAIRIAAMSEAHSGYVLNNVLEGDADDLHDRKQQYVRLMTRWQPSQNFSMLLNLSSLDQNNTGAGIWGYQQIGALVNGQYEPGHPFAPAGVLTDQGPWVVSRNMASLAELENLSYSLSLRWNIGFATLEWLGNTSKFESVQVFDSDYSAGGDPYNSEFNGWDSFRDTRSGELRLHSNPGGRFDWLLGLNATSLETDWGWLQTRGRLASRPDWDSQGKYTTDTTAVYADGGFAATDRLRLFAGLRWYKDKKSLRNNARDSWNDLLWRAGLQYKINTGTMAWLSASTGYRAAGLNELPGVPATYAPEQVTAYELGLKRTLANGAVVVNLAAFYNDYTDMQAQSFTVLPLPGNAGLMDYMSTAGDMEAKGVEAEIRWLPAEHWDIKASMAWLDAQFTHYAVPGLAGLGAIPGHTTTGSLSLDGWHPAFSPDWSLGLQASYRVGMGRWGNFTPMIQTSYASEYYANDLNLEGARQGAQSKTDVRFFWDLPEHHIRMQLYVENVTEEETLKNVVIYNPEERPDIATFLANWGDPRTYGFIFSYQY